MKDYPPETLRRNLSLYIKTAFPERRLAYFPAESQGGRLFWFCSGRRSLGLTKLDGFRVGVCSFMEKAGAVGSAVVFLIAKNSRCIRRIPHACRKSLTLLSIAISERLIGFVRILFAFKMPPAEPCEVACLASQLIDKSANVEGVESFDVEYGFFYGQFRRDDENFVKIRSMFFSCLVWLEGLGDVVTAFLGAW